MRGWVHGEKCIFTHIYSWKLWHPYRVDAEKQILMEWINFFPFLCPQNEEKRENPRVFGTITPGQKQWNYLAARVRRLKLTYYSSSISAIFGFTFSNQSSYSRYMWSSLPGSYLQSRLGDWIIPTITIATGLQFPPYWLQNSSRS